MPPIVLYRLRQFARIGRLAGLIPIVFASVAQAQSVIDPNDIIPKIINRGPTPLRKTASARVDVALLTLAEEHRRFRARNPPASERFRSAVPRVRLSNDDYVLVDAISNNASTLRSTLTTLGLRQSAQRGRMVSGWIPIAVLDQLEQQPGLQNVRPVFMTTFTGAATTQGDTALNAAAARVTYGVNGNGVIVGVMSDSYNCKGGAASGVASNDLPSGIMVLSDLSGSACTSATDEGRAMMEIVHDIASGSTLAFHTAFNGTADFANGIVALKQSANANIIVDDVIYFAEPMFQDGIIAQAVDAVANQGVAYFSAAGNLAMQSYESPYRGSGSMSPFTSGERHDFDASGAVDAFLDVTIPVNQTVILVLQWNQPFFSVSGPPGATTDLDLVLYNSAGTSVKAIAATNNLGGDAVEAFGFQNPGPSTNFKIAIERVTGPAPTVMKLVWSGPLTLQQFATNSSTLYGHANAKGARAVGASYYINTPAFGVSPAAINSYSALGGTPILFDINGASQTVLRYKPELVATDGGDTTFFGTDTNSNGLPNFFGTSAAAPHAAGVAALLLQHAPQSTPSLLYQAMLESALDMGQAGFDFRSGAGLIQANTALDWQTLAQGSGEIGFNSLPDGTPSIGDVAINAYQSQGLTFQVSNRSDGYATLSASPTTGLISGLSGASLIVSGIAGTPFISLHFTNPISQLNFAFATASGAIQVQLYDSNNQLTQTMSFNGTTSIGFSGANRLGGNANLSNLNFVSRAVIRTLGSDTDLRIDGIHFVTAAGSVTPSNVDADAPTLPSWGMLLLVCVLLIVMQRSSNRHIKISTT